MLNIHFTFGHKLSGQLGFHPVQLLHALTKNKTAQKYVEGYFPLTMEKKREGFT